MNSKAIKMRSTQHRSIPIPSFWICPYQWVTLIRFGSAYSVFHKHKVFHCVIISWCRVVQPAACLSITAYPSSFNSINHATNYDSDWFIFSLHIFCDGSLNSARCQCEFRVHKHSQTCTVFSTINNNAGDCIVSMSNIIASRSLSWMKLTNQRKMKEKKYEKLFLE